MLGPAHLPLTRKQQRPRKLSRQSWGAWTLLAGLLLAIWGTAAGIVWWTARKASASDHLPAVTLEPDQDLVYDLWNLEPGQSRFFTYPSGASERLRLLVNRDSDGVIRAAFATCTTCYSFRNQHYLKAGQFICGRCRTAMTIGGQGERMTPDKGCVAVRVPFSIEHNRVMVRAQAIQEGAKELAEAAGKVAGRADASSKPPGEDP